MAASWAVVPCATLYMRTRRFAAPLSTFASNSQLREIAAGGCQADAAANAALCMCVHHSKVPDGMSTGQQASCACHTTKHCPHQQCFSLW